MEKINPELLQQIAHLSRLHVPAGKEEEMLQSLNKILDWMEQLNEIDTEGVEPLVYISEAMNELREDEIQENLPAGKILENAPQKKGDYFVVPKVLE